MVSVIILLLAFTVGDYGFIDIAIVFMLTGFVGVLWTIKVLTPSVWHFEMPTFIKAEDDEKGGSSND